jgi:alcohol dehydrogenase YqhD (iron-dependent ADH family)
MKAVAIVKEENRLHPAVGGGSVIDGVKFISSVNLKETNRNITKKRI